MLIMEDSGPEVTTATQLQPRPPAPIQISILVAVTDTVMAPVWRRSIDRIASERS